MSIIDLFKKHKVEEIINNTPNPSNTPVTNPYMAEAEKLLEEINDIYTRYNIIIKNNYNNINELQGVLTRYNNAYVVLKNRYSQLQMKRMEIEDIEASFSFGTKCSEIKRKLEDIELMIKANTKHINHVQYAEEEQKKPTNIYANRVAKIKEALSKKGNWITAIIKEKSELYEEYLKDLETLMTDIEETISYGISNNINTYELTEYKKDTEALVPFLRKAQQHQKNKDEAKHQQERATIYNYATSKKDLEERKERLTTAAKNLRISMINKLQTGERQLNTESLQSILFLFQNLITAVTELEMNNGISLSETDEIIHQEELATITFMRQNSKDIMFNRKADSEINRIKSDLLLIQSTASNFGYDRETVIKTSKEVNEFLENEKNQNRFVKGTIMRNRIKDNLMNLNRNELTPNQLENLTYMLLSTYFEENIAIIDNEPEEIVNISAKNNIPIEEARKIYYSNLIDTKFIGMDISSLLSKSESYFDADNLTV